MRVQNGRGRHIELGEMINKGGEAEIRLVKGQPALVAKIYHAHRTEREAKLKAMLEKVPVQPATHTALAWPIELLYGQGKLVGFLMPKIDGYDRIFNFYNPALRKKRHPGFNWRYLHRTASNLAIVVETVHQAGHLIGDLNESNVLLNDRALVTLVDTDSFQIKGPKTGIYHCLVGKAEYTPAELQGVSLSSVNRQPEHDYFGLAVLIFQLLMQGYHPFSGVLSTALSVGRVDVYGIKEGIFPYHQNGTLSRIQTPPNAPSFALLHPDLQALFIRCFVNGHQKPTERPTAREWRAFLQKAEQALVMCTRETTHIYSNHLGGCPFCPKEQTMQMPLPATSRIPIQKAQTVQVKTQSTAGKKVSWFERFISCIFMFALLFAFRMGISTIISFTNSFDIGEQEHTSQTSAIASPTTSPVSEPIAAIAVQNTNRVRPLADLPKKEVREIAYSPDGKSLVVAHSTGISLIDSQTLEEVYLIDTNYAVHHYAFSDDGQIIASASDDHNVRLWDSNGTLIKTLEQHISSVRSMAFSPDGQILAIASDDKVHLWSIDDMAMITLSAHTDDVNRVLFSPDGSLLASASDDEVVQLWSTDGTPLHRLVRHKSRVTDIAFSPDSKILASASDDNTVRLWSTDGTYQKTLRGHTLDVRIVLFSPDGQILASASEDNTVRLWSTDGTLIKVLKEHISDIQSMAFDVDGQMLASGSYDGTMRLWSTDGTAITSLSGHTWSVNRITFSPDGKTLASASSDDTVRLWGVPP